MTKKSVDSSNLSVPGPQSFDSDSAPSPKNGKIICFKSDRMGSGPQELGAMLIKAFINSINEIIPLPEYLVFYNTGIMLTVEGSPVVESLLALQNKGVKILICGTCANYFDKKEHLAIGEISNMLAIHETLSNASRVIYP